MLLEAGGGLAILAGFRTRSVAVILAGYLVLVNLVAHPFWVQPDQMRSFLKNMGLIGGLLLQSHVGSGDYSLENYLE